MKEFDEKAFDEEMQRQEYLNAKAVAARENNKYTPEISCAGANWIVSEPQETREDALIIAEVHVQQIQKQLKGTIDRYITSNNLRKAKG